MLLSNRPGIRNMVRYIYFNGGPVNKSLRTLLVVFSVILIPALMSAQTNETAEVPDVKGSWDLTYDSESAGLTQTAAFELQQKGSRLQGTYVTDAGEGVLRGSISPEGEILLKQIDPVIAVIEAREDTPEYRTTIEFRCNVSDDASMIEGTFIATNIESGKVVSERRFSADRN